jgi:hypothetical protein
LYENFETGIHVWIRGYLFPFAFPNVFNDEYFVIEKASYTSLKFKNTFYAHLLAFVGHYVYVPQQILLF